VHGALPSFPTRRSSDLEQTEQRRAVVGLASVFRANVPQIYLDVDRAACMTKGVALRDVFMTLQVYLGSLYVNDFNRFGRTWQVRSEEHTSELQSLAYLV